MESDKQLSMANSGFFSFDRLPGRTALGYIEEEKGWRTNTYALPIVGASDGGMYSTVGDIERLWDAFFQQSGVVRVRSTNEWMDAVIAFCRLPKPGGKGIRLLGVPTVRDRVVHATLKALLEPIFEPLRTLEDPTLRGRFDALVEQVGLGSV